MEQSELLKKLEEIVNNNRNPETKQSNSWVGAVIIFFVSMLAIIVFAYISNKQAKEIAQLKYEKDKLEVEKENAELKAKTAANDLQQKQLLEEVIAVKAEIGLVEKKIQNVAIAQAKDQAAINSIRGWNDL